MASDIGFGAKLSIKDGSAFTTHVDYPDTVVLVLPKIEFGEYEEKLLDTATKDRTFKPTLKDNGEVPVESYYTKASYARIRALLGVNPVEFKVWPPDLDGAGSAVDEVGTITGWVKTLGEPKFEKDKEMMFTFTIRVNTITFADGTNNFAPAS